MKFFQLAYACRVYMVLTDSDADYHTFLDKTGDRLDFTDSTHMNALLEWLRKWGCRQFAVDYHNLAAESIRKWAEQWNSELPDPSATLDRLTNEEIKEIGNAYAHLSQSAASKRTRDGGLNDVKIGPTGAAKILFAARPNVCPPWDGSIRGVTFDDSIDSYCKYVTQVQKETKQLCDEAAELGIPPEKIPLEIGQPRSTLLKLVDEYNWVTVTKESPPLEPHDVANWYAWSR